MKTLGSCINMYALNILRILNHRHFHPFSLLSAFCDLFDTLFDTAQLLIKFEILHSYAKIENLFDFIP